MRYYASTKLNLKTSSKAINRIVYAVGDALKMYKDAMT